MNEWETRETAPKDGTEFLAVYATTWHGRQVGDYSIVRWIAGTRNDWVAQAGGQNAIEAQGDTYTEYIQPFFTHWMPLPKLPKEQET